jgi:hypothetical protein
MNTRGLFDLNQAAVEDEVRQEDVVLEEHSKGDDVHGEGDAIQEEHGEGDVVQEEHVEAAHQFDLNIQAEEDELIHEPGTSLYQNCPYNISSPEIYVTLKLNKIGVLRLHQQSVASNVFHMIFCLLMYVP